MFAVTAAGLPAIAVHHGTQSGFNAIDLSAHMRDVAMVDRALVIVPLPDGRWLGLDRDTFEAALLAGAGLAPAAAQGSKSANHSAQVALVDATEIGRVTNTSASWWEAAARDSDCPALFIGKVRRFNVEECLAWLARVQERDANGRSRRCAAAPRAGT